MDEVAAKEYTLATGEWWWVASLFGHLLHETIHHLESTAGEDLVYSESSSSRGTGMGVTQAGGIAVFSVAIAGEDMSTRIVIRREAPPFIGMGAKYVSYLTLIVTRTKMIRRAALGAGFQEILDEYYMRRKHDSPMTLRELARTYGANYNSLRQAKIRYDAERRHTEDASDD